MAIKHNCGVHSSVNPNPNLIPCTLTKPSRFKSFLCVHFRNHATHSPQERPRSALARTHESRSSMPTSSGIHNRPASALVRSRSATSLSKSRTSSRSSHAGSIAQNGLTPTPPVATNRTTQLRLNAARRAESGDDWVLKETREYLERSRSNSSRRTTTQKGEMLRCGLILFLRSF